MQGYIVDKKFAITFVVHDSEIPRWREWRKENNYNDGYFDYIDGSMVSLQVVMKNLTYSDACAGILFWNGAKIVAL